MLNVHRVDDDAQFAQLAADWDRLSQDVPFRRFAWHAGWWRCFAAPGRALYVLVARDAAGVVRGIAPWYLENAATRGRAVQWLGSGIVCSDYQTILAETDHIDAVTEALADWLSAAPSDAKHGWDVLQLEVVVTGDPVMDRFISHLWSGGNTIHRTAGPNCWRIALPATWKEYVDTLSKSHRKQVRRFERRQLETGKSTFHTVENETDLRRGMEILVDLHQRRRQSLGEPGCFADAAFSQFLHQLAGELFASGHLRLAWIEIDGTPAAVEFQLAGGGVTYAYQAGVNPDLLDEEPGRVINIATIRRAIEEGHAGFDFLRGDEPYKAHWRAEPRETTTYRIVPGRTLAQARHGLWLASDSLKSWVKTGLELTGMK